MALVMEAITKLLNVDTMEVIVNSSITYIPTALSIILILWATSTVIKSPTISVVVASTAEIA